MKKSFLISICLLLSFATLQSQTNEINEIKLKGLYDSEGNKLFDCEYENISGMTDNIFRAQKNGKWGILDRKGNRLLPFEYESIRVFTKNLMVVGDSATERVIDLATKKEIIPPAYDYIGSVSNGFSVVSKDGKWGTIDIIGNEVLPCKYGYMESFRNSYTLAVSPTEFKWGIIDYKGNNIIPFIYDEINDYENLGVAVIRQNRLYGLIHPSDGKEIVPCRYNRVDTPQVNVIRVLDTKWGGYHVSGKEIIPFEYTVLTPFDGMYTRAFKDNKWGVLNNQGSIVLPLEYSYITNISEDFAFVKDPSSNKYGLYNLKKDKLITEYKYIRIEPFNGGVGPARTSEGWCVLDRNGKELTKSIFNEIKVFSEDLAPASKKVDEGLLNNKDNNSSLTKANYAWGVIDKKGKQIAPFIYSTIYPYSDGAAIAKRGEKYYVLNKKGKETTKGYEKVETLNTQDPRDLRFINGIIIVYNNGRKGILNSNGKEIVPCIYDEIIINENGTFVVQ